MFMFDKDWSIKHMYEELERWVQFKRRQADRVSELPMVSALGSRLAEGIQKAQEHTHVKAVDSLVEGGFRYEPVPALFVVCYDQEGGTTLLEIPVVFGNEEENGKTFAYVRGLKKPVLHFPDITEDITLEELFRFASGRVAAAGRIDPIDRWLTATSERFRSENPICPKCGYGGVYIGEFSRRTTNGEVDEKRVCCSTCDWVSHRRYAYLSDFVEKKAFRYERNYVLSEERAIARVEDATKGAQEALNKLFALANDKMLVHHAGRKLLDSIKEIGIEAQEAIAFLKERV